MTKVSCRSPTTIKDLDPTQDCADKSHHDTLADEGLKAVDEKLSAASLSSPLRKPEACCPDETMKDESMADNVPQPYRPASTKRSKKEKVVIDESRIGK